MPWLAALFFRAFFFRDFFAMLASLNGTALPFGGSGPDDASPARHPSHLSPCRMPSHDWIPFARTLTDEEGDPMAEEIRAEMVANVWKVVAAVGGAR
ncbi:hypothetical protein AAFH96_21870, partial [Polymorphospora sp. 2-325]